MVAVGVTLPLDVPDAKPSVPAPVHAYVSAAGLQLAVNIDDDPALTVVGEADRVHVGVGVGAGDDDVTQVAVRSPLEFTETLE